MSMLCSRCKKRVAVVFMTRMENGKTINEGLCLQCAKELGIGPVNELMEKMGITDDEIENMNDQLMGMMDEDGEEIDLDSDSDDSDFVPGGAQTFPFLQNMFGKMNGAAGQNPQETPEKKTRRPDKREKKAPKRKFLEAYCTDLTQKARDGQLDRIIGRDEEIYRVVQILNRRTKNNPCLIGEPGVGKTAIAEGIAQQIASGTVPLKLKDKEIHLLDMTALVAGTQFRGQFESRVKGLIDEVRALGALEGSEKNKAKRVLAYEVTKLVHGEDEAKKAQEAARAAFSGGGTDISAMPTTPFEAAKLAGEGMGVVNFIKELGLVPSNREGFMTIEQGGLKIDGEKVTDKKLQITADSFKDGKMLVEKGKKKKVVVELV